MGKRLPDLIAAGTLYPGDLFFVDNQGSSRKVTVQNVARKVLGENTQGVKRLANISVDANGFITAITSGVATSTAVLAFPSVAAADKQELTITVSGASTGNTVSLGLPPDFPAGLIPTAWVSATNVVKVRLTNITASPIAPPQGAYSATVIFI